MDLRRVSHQEDWIDFISLPKEPTVTIVTHISLSTTKWGKGHPLGSRNSHMEVQSFQHLWWLAQSGQRRHETWPVHIWASNYPQGALTAQTLRSPMRSPDHFPQIQSWVWRNSWLVIFFFFLQHDQWPGQILDKPGSLSGWTESARVSANAVNDTTALLFYPWICRRLWVILV